MGKLKEKFNENLKQAFKKMCLCLVLTEIVQIRYVFVFGFQAIKGKRESKLSSSD